jgi:hypothetical protein
MTIKTTTYARVQVTVEITAGGTWGQDCTLDQVFRQATEEAIGKIRRELERVDIIGEPKVLAITTERTP